MNRVKVSVSEMNVYAGVVSASEAYGGYFTPYPINTQYGWVLEFKNLEHVVL